MSESKLETALAKCQIFSRTSGASHQLILEFETLKAMQDARDAIIKSSAPEVRKFAESGRAASPDLAHGASSEVVDDREVAEANGEGDVNHF